MLSVAWDGLHRQVARNDTFSVLPTINVKTRSVSHSMATGSDVGGPVVIQTFTIALSLTMGRFESILCVLSAERLHNSGRRRKGLLHVLRSLALSC